MTIAGRLAIVAYLMVLTVGMLAGQWPLQGPLVVGTVGSHGLHAGDVVVLTMSAIASIAVLRHRG